MLQLLSANPRYRAVKGMKDYNLVRNVVGVFDRVSHKQQENGLARSSSRLLQQAYRLR